MLSRKVLYSAIAAAGMVFGAGTALADNPYKADDRSWMNLNGTVETIEEDSFVLDYGYGEIIVEMDDWDDFNETDHLAPGDLVSVTGKIDADLFQKRTLEADRVYNVNDGIYYFADHEDEEWNNYAFTDFAEAEDNARLSLNGTVASVDGDEFTLNTGDRLIRVDTDELDNNPLDDEGTMKIEKGDRVTVYGELDKDFFSSDELEADRIVEFQRMPVIVIDRQS